MWPVLSNVHTLFVQLCIGRPHRLNLMITKLANLLHQLLRHFPFCLAVTRSPNDSAMPCVLARMRMAPAREPGAQVSPYMYTDNRNNRAIQQPITSCATSSPSSAPEASRSTLMLSRASSPNTCRPLEMHAGAVGVNDDDRLTLLA